MMKNSENVKRRRKHGGWSLIKKLKIINGKLIISIKEQKENTGEEESTGNQMGLVYWKMKNGEWKLNGRVESIMGG